MPRRWTNAHLEQPSDAPAVAEDVADRRADIDDRRLSLGAYFRLRRRNPITSARREALERRRREQLERQRGAGEEALLCERVEVAGGAR